MNSSKGDNWKNKGHEVHTLSQLEYGTFWFLYQLNLAKRQGQPDNNIL